MFFYIKVYWGHQNVHLSFFCTMVWKKLNFLANQIYKFYVREVRCFIKSNLFLSLNLNILLAAKLLQLCPTLCDPIGGSPSGSPVPAIL